MGIVYAIVYASAIKKGTQINEYPMISAIKQPYLNFLATKQALWPPNKQLGSRVKVLCGPPKPL